MLVIALLLLKLLALLGYVIIINIDDARVRILFLFDLFVSLGFESCKLIKTFTNCINRHNLIEKFNTIGHFYLLFLFNYIFYCVIVNQFDAWCGILKL